VLQLKKYHLNRETHLRRERGERGRVQLKNTTSAENGGRGIKNKKYNSNVREAREGKRYSSVPGSLKKKAEEDSM
jgi:hypothetical protein